MTEDVFK